MSVTASVRSEIKKLGIGATTEASLLLALASKLDDTDLPPSPIVREIVEILQRARGVQAVESPSDDLVAARAKRRRGLNALG